jgi:hypothetical protein
VAEARDLLMQLRYTNGGVPVLDDRLPLTVQRLQAMVVPTPVIYRVEDAHTYEWREPTKDERARVRAWLRRFIQQRGCSPAGHHPVHRVGVVLFWPVWN